VDGKQTVTLPRKHGGSIPPTPTLVGWRQKQGRIPRKVMPNVEQSAAAIEGAEAGGEQQELVGLIDGASAVVVPLLQPRV
jgi:hypothetical protein